MDDRKRSRPNPLSTPSEAFDHTRSIARELGTGPFKREDAVKAMGYQMLSGTAARRFAALSLYGLIDGRGETYHLTSLGKRVFRPLPDEEATLKREAFLTVEIFKSVIDEYRGEGALPNSLGIILERRFGIAAGSGDTVAKIIRLSAQEAGIVDEGNRILDSMEPDIAEVESVSEPTEQILPPPVVQSIPAQSKSIEGGTIVHSLPRSGVSLTHPEKIDKKDLERIAKWLDLVVKPALEFAVDADEDIVQND